MLQWSAWFTSYQLIAIELEQAYAYAWVQIPKIIKDGLYLTPEMLGLARFEATTVEQNTRLGNS